MKKPYSKWTEERKEKHRAYNRKWRKENPIKYRTYKKGYNKKHPNIHYLRKYGISETNYKEMIFQQKERCYICGEKEGNGRRLCVDHNHEDGKIRKLLCQRCNRVLGFVGDSRILLERLLSYVCQFTSPTCRGVALGLLEEER